MQLSYFDIETYTTSTQAAGLKKLSKYRAEVARVVSERDNKANEYSLIHVADQNLHDTIDSLKKQFKGIKHLVLIGIGGSDLGTKAVHRVLGEEKVKLHSLDTVSSHQVTKLIETLKVVKRADKIAVCIVSKSGGTAETLVNAGVLLGELENRLGKEIHQQAIYIGNTGTDLMKTAKRMGSVTVPMPEIVGGRFSVATEVGLIPLALLGHDTDAFIEGVLDATSEDLESVAAENAVRLNHYAQKNFSHYNFFAFEPRLYQLGGWYRQLMGESIGKEKDRAGKEMKKGFVPSITTAVELHSMGQLYMSGFAGVFTDFVVFDDNKDDIKIPKKNISKAYGGKTVDEVAAAIYGGVMGAYQERKLPYRSTILEDQNMAYSLGLFMTMRMLEIMYLAELMNLNAFDQPNVELYKDKTRKILGL